MRYIKVYIDDEAIDLVPGQAIAMTYQLNDIGDIRNQRANFSNLFKAARTKHNDRVLGFIGDFGTTDKRPYRLLPARVTIDGEDVISNGYATIKRTDKYYNIVIYSGVIDLFEKVGDKKLADLDLSEFDHTFNLTTIQGLLNASSGICYPVVDYGQLITSNTVLIDYMRFAIYAKEVFERILTEAGFSFSGSFLSHAHYTKLLIPFTNEALTNKEAATEFEFAVEDFAVNAPDTFTPVTGAEYTVGTHAVRGKLSFEGELSDAFGGTQKTAVRLVSSTKGIIGYAKQEIAGTSVTVKINVESHDYEAGEVLALEVKHNNEAGITVNGLFKFAVSKVTPYGGFVPVAENLPDIKQKDFLKAIAQLYGLIYDIDIEAQKVRIRFLDDLIGNKASAKDWSTKLDLSKQPEITYTLDFAQVNNFSFDNGTEEGQETGANDGNVPYSLGRGAILSDNTTLKLEDDTVTLPFAASEEPANDIVDPGSSLNLPLIKMLQPTNKVEAPTFGVGDTNETPLPFYYSPTAYGAPPTYNAETTYSGADRVRHNGAVWEWQSSETSSGKEPGVALDNGDDGTNYAGLPYWKVMPIESAFIFTQNIKVKPRILLAAEGTNNLFFQGEQHGGDFFENDYIQPVFDGFLDFETRIAENYKIVQDTANDTKVVKAYFNLSPEDIRTLDHLVPVYVRYFSAFFYVQKIDKYQQGQSTAVTLVKI